MDYLYNLAIRLYGLALWLASGWNLKARQWRDGRKGWQEDLLESNDEFRFNDWIWIHCASLGEYEQGRPIIRKIRETTSYRILLSFYSPSGYLKIKDNSEANKVIYMPLDTPDNASFLVNTTNPKFAIFIRYEFWYNHLKQLNRSGTPTFLISSSFRKNQPFFRPFIGRWFRQMLGYFDAIFTIDDASVELLKAHDIRHADKAGDTRADRVITILNNDDTFPRIEAYCSDAFTIIAGSTWESDLSILEYSIRELPEIKWIFAPHEVNEDFILNQTKCLEQGDIPYALYSEWDGIEDIRVLILDNVGMLSRIYKFASVAYVGGGYGAGIHNVLEPAVYGIPVLFGTRYHKFPEAVGLVSNNGARSIAHAKDMYQIIQELYQNDSVRISKGRQAGQYVRSLSGATEKILDTILKKKGQD